MNKEIDISKVILNTERLVLRPWRQAELTRGFTYGKLMNLESRVRDG